MRPRLRASSGSRAAAAAASSVRSRARPRRRVPPLFVSRARALLFIAGSSRSGPRPRSRSRRTSRHRAVLAPRSSSAFLSSVIGQGSRSGSAMVIAVPASIVAAVVPSGIAVVSRRRKGSHSAVHSAVSSSSSERRRSSKWPLSSSLAGWFHDDGHSEQAVPVQLVHGVLRVPRRLELDEAEVDLLAAVLEVEVDQFPVISEQVLHVTRVRAVGNVANIQTVLGHRFGASSVHTTERVCLCVLE